MKKRARKFQLSTCAKHLCTLLIYRLSKMMINDDYVIVQKSLFDCLRQHCECCSDFAEQLQNLSNERAIVISHEHSSDEPSKKRKTLHELQPQEVLQSLHLSQQLESQLSLHSSQQLESQLPSQLSQQSESQLSFKSSNTFKSKKLKNANAKKSRKRSQQKSRKNAIANQFLQNTLKIIEWRKLINQRLLVFFESSFSILWLISKVLER